MDDFVQASGEAQYTDDMPEQKNSLFAAFVGSTEALAVIKGVDASAALALPGVVAYIGAEDVPGVNKAATGDAELLFATDKVLDLSFPYFLNYRTCDPWKP